MNADREPLEPPLNPPEPRRWRSTEEWFADSGHDVEVDYMGLTLQVCGRLGFICWEAIPGRDAIEGRALCAYATFLGEPGDRIFEAIAAGAEIGCNWYFADLLPESEVAAIRELAIETARKSGQWRE